MDTVEGKKSLKHNLQGLGQWSQNWHAIHLHIE